MEFSSHLTSEGFTPLPIRVFNMMDRDGKRQEIDTHGPRPFPEALQG